MPREINESAIVMFRVFLQQQGGVAVVYAYLGGREDEDFFLTKGLAYTYARLALGVVEQNTVSGRVALNFMKATAAEKGQPVDQKKIDSILHDMAQGYVDALTLQRDSVGRIHITRDINHEEAWNFHSEVFRKAGYGEDAWTLHSVFRVMPEANREIYWKQVLASAGDIKAELELAGKTYALMRIVQLQGSDEAQKIADRWLDNIESIENAQAVIDVGGTKLEQSIETLFEGMVDFIHEKFVPQPYVPQPYFPMPLPTVNPLGGSAPAPVLPPMPIPAPPVRRRRKGRRGRRPPTTAGGYGYGGSYSGEGVRLTLDP